MKNKITIVATGDSLFTADIPNEYFNNDFKPIHEFIKSCDLKMTNLETNIMKYGEFSSAFSGGTWLNCEPEDFDDLTRFGFNYYSTANNHCMDYSYHGMFSTIKNLDDRGLTHSGTGDSLAKAAAPATVNIKDISIGIISVDTSHKYPSKAGEETPYIKARPGVNYVGFNQYFPIDENQLNQLKSIEKSSKINAYENLLVESGFSLEMPKGLYKFGETIFCYDGSKKKTECDTKDKIRFLKDVEKAKKDFDYVVIAIHCHEIGDTRHEEVPDFLTELCHDSIDAGANAIICNGTHQLRPIEVYKGSPIFYSLGDFIYQGMRVKYLPSDFLMKYGVDKNATAYEGLMARSKNNTIGLQVHRCNFLTVLPKMTFDCGKLVGVEMLPVVAGFKREGKMEGLPYYAKGKEAKEIYNILNSLSKPYGTKLILENDVIKIEL